MTRQAREKAPLADARKLAVAHLAEIIPDDPNCVWGGEDIRVEVTDAKQMILFTVIALSVDAPAVAGQWAT